MKIAIIPARGGSKRIPGKNIRLFANKPLINYPIEACLESGLFEHILVSTDSEEIADVARSAGAEVPFLRPHELSGDFVPTAPVVEHAVRWAENAWGKCSAYCQLYANPFVQVETLKQGFELMESKDADVVLGVTEFPYPILRALKLDKKGRVVYAFPEYEASRSQDLPIFYHDAAQFYWHTCKLRDYPHDQIAIPLILPRYMVVDIDTEDDWYIAERQYSLFFTEKN